VPPISTSGNDWWCICGDVALLCPVMEPSTGQQTFEQYMAGQAERQTNAIETIRNYVFYLLLITVVGLVIGGLVALSGASGF
jgi:hypothetical protein